MRSDKSPYEFFLKMNKKPALQNILDNVDSYTSDQLQSIAGQPLWIRNILVDIKNKTTPTDKALSAEYMADRMVQDLPRMHLEYNVMHWTGNTWYMPCGLTGNMQIEITFDDIFIVLDSLTHKVKTSSSVGTLSNEHWNYFLQNTKNVGLKTIPQYSEYVSNYLSTKHVGNEKIAKIAAPTSYVGSKNNNGGFTIIRH